MAFSSGPVVVPSLHSGTIQPRAFRSLNAVVPLVSVSNYYYNDVITYMCTNRLGTAPVIRYPSHSPLLLLFSLLLLPYLVSAELYHVKPPNSTLPCVDPDVNHCRTLQDYAIWPPRKVVDVTFLFMAGEHPLSHDFSISNISSLSLTYQEDSGVVTINCSEDGKFVFANVKNVVISDLTMLGCYGNQIVNATSFVLDNANIEGPSDSDYGPDSDISIPYLCSEALGMPIILSFSASSVQITRTRFKHNIVDFVVCVHSHSNITIENTTFQDSTAASLVHVYESNFTLVNSDFLQNIVFTTMFMYGSNGTIAGCDVTSTTGIEGGVLFAEKSDINVFLSNFSDNYASRGGGAFIFLQSDFNIEGCTFTNNTVNLTSIETGAALHVQNSTANITGTTFTQNFAKSGSIFANYSELHLHSSQFLSNTAIYGGALTIRHGQIYINHKIHSCDRDDMVEFSNNSAWYGGALNIIETSVAFIRCTTFVTNSAKETNDSRGGAILARTNTIVSLVDTQFCGNDAEVGGVLFAQFPTLNSSGDLDVQNNRGQSFSLHLTNCTANFRGNLTFSNNHLSLLTHYSVVTFCGTSLFANGSAIREAAAITSIRSDINVHGMLTAQSNQGENGGAMLLIQSELNVYGQCNFQDNYASKRGGAIHAEETVISFEGIASFWNNSANDSGGAISMDRSTIRHFSGKVSFTKNHAHLGGGLYLCCGSRLRIIKLTMECDINTWYCISDRQKWQALSFTSNSADRGGAIYVDDVGSNFCSSLSSVSTFHDECFIQTIAAYKSASDWDTSTANFANIYFDDNIASDGGAVLYGGLLDRCTLDKFAEIKQFEQHNISALSYFKNISRIIDFSKNDIASDPLRVCLCDENNKVDCDMTLPDYTFVPGRMFSNNLAVVDQTCTPFNESLYISASLSSESSRLEEGESEQMLEGQCSELHFTLYSNNSVSLTLFVKDSPCTYGKSKLVLALSIDVESKCPVGFSVSNASLGCECDLELNDYVTNCDIQNSSVQRQGNTWISLPHGNYSNDSDILVHNYCPYDYCQPPSENAKIWINLSDPNGLDAQCAFNRTGQLCGCCKDGYSLTLGGSECRPCTNTWLVLIILFALAGIALVLVMMVCNLTLATGTINGPLFYANILIANRFVFFPQHKLSVPLQVFVSMLGLNLGITTCFYDGLDGLGKIFMQIAFEAYLIILVVLVILMGKSIRVSNFFHKYNLHPLHTLATLIVLSYEKLSRKIFSLFAHTSLRYVYNDTTTNPIWLFDTCEGVTSGNE